MMASASVEWATSLSGELSIALRFNGMESWPWNRWSVWALYHGTHDLAPVSRNFKRNDEQGARYYANTLWQNW